MYCEKTYHDKTVLLTGATGDIGMEIARELSCRGARLLLVARHAEKLHALSAEIVAAGGDAVPMPCDITNQESVQSLIKQVRERFETIHLLVNNAGRELAKPLQVSRPQDFRDLFEINVFALAEMTRCMLQVMKSGSAIVHVASLTGMVGSPGLGVYAASKAAVIALTRTASKELAGRKIRVNAVAPGLIESEMTQRIFSKYTPEQVASLKASYPLGLGTPRDVACGVAFLGGDEAAWITGQTLVIDGGNSI